ncbi:MAG: FkbM family methyltransferase [Candidatus Sulfotelmatobacter sp.]
MRPTIGSFYVALHRTYSILKKSAEKRILRQWPGTGSGLDRLKRLVQRHFLRRAHTWVRIQSGLSQGLWMRVRASGEASLWRGEHELEVQKAILAGVRPGGVVYDVGAHVGLMALGAAQLVGNLGRVVAFDGDPENIERLRGNSVRNGLEGHLLVVHAAVWSRTVSNGLSFRRGTTARSQGGVEADGNRPVLARGEIINVPSITLDDFVAAGGPPPQLLKIDVEGGEYEVLRGGTTLFATQRPLIIAEIHHQQAAEQIATWLNEHRYKAQWKAPEEKFPQRLFAWPTEQDGEAWMRDVSLRQENSSRGDDNVA